MVLSIYQISDPSRYIYICFFWVVGVYYIVPFLADVVTLNAVKEDIVNSSARARNLLHV